LSAPVTLRHATTGDSDLLLAWRNDPVTIAMSMTPEPVTPEEHINWFSHALADDARTLLIAEADNTPVGTVRLDTFADGEYEVSITVSPDHRGQGFGQAILAAANTLAFTALGVHRLVATVKEDNHASRRIFERTGYQLQATEDGVCLYHNTGETPGAESASWNLQ
jgi:RimJ/RimL family protein N-acetyltransferase